MFPNTARRGFRLAIVSVTCVVPMSACQTSSDFLHTSSYDHLRAHACRKVKVFFSFATNCGDRNNIFVEQNSTLRYFIELSYDGSSFVGWQRQPTGNSVQSCLEDALKTLLQKPISVVGAGRTDAGVHARQLFAHVDLDDQVDQNLEFRLNKLLPKEIAVNSTLAVTDDAHARFDATEDVIHHITTQKILGRNVPIISLSH